MSLNPLNTVADLRDYLQVAIALEHATLPPYLIAMYSLKPGHNSAAYQQIRMVAIEEMLHLVLSANILNAVGGTPDLTAPDFVPKYPTHLQNGEKDFVVNVQRFSKEAINNFLQIERPVAPPHDHGRFSRSMTRSAATSYAVPPVRQADGQELHFCTIGEFYKEICEKMELLEKEANARNETIFTGDPARQIDAGYYYSGGGEILVVTDLTSASKAIRLITEQGEGYEGGIFDYEGELSHYYRFQQIKLGRYYVCGDKPDHPTGARFTVDWDAVYPVKCNSDISDYRDHPELLAAVMDFRATYQTFLENVTKALTGQPQILQETVGEMFRLKEKFYHLMKNPIPGQCDVNAAPVFGPIR